MISGLDQVQQRNYGFFNLSRDVWMERFQMGWRNFPEFERRSKTKGYSIRKNLLVQTRNGRAPGNDSRIFTVLTEQE